MDFGHFILNKIDNNEFVIQHRHLNDNSQLRSTIA